MFLKAFGILTPVAAGAVWVFGGFGGGYTRDVARPPAEVMAALMDLDITQQPGSPGTDPARAGGVTPVFQVERAADRVIWTVMSGDKVATRMTAFVQPIDGGGSRVTANVERGDAPDDFVSPAFRSKGITMGLFGMALEGELNELTAPPRRSRAECVELEQRLLMGSPGAFAGRPQNVTEGIGQGAQTIMGLHAVEAELRRQGCDTSGGDAFVEPTNRMGGSAGPAGEADAKVTFEPGKPMVDLSKR